MFWLGQGGSEHYSPPKIHRVLQEHSKQAAENLGPLRQSLLKAAQQRPARYVRYFKSSLCRNPDRTRSDGGSKNPLCPSQCSCHSSLHVAARSGRCLGQPTAGWVVLWDWCLSLKSSGAEWEGGVKTSTERETAQPLSSRFAEMSRILGQIFYL